jgi:hypothetical protein
VENLQHGFSLDRSTLEVIPSIFEALTASSRMSHKKSPTRTNKHQDTFSQLYCFINGVSLTALSVDANLFYI